MVFRARFHDLLFEDKCPSGLNCKHSDTGNGTGLDRLRPDTRNVEPHVVHLLSDFYGNRTTFLAGKLTASNEAFVSPLEGLYRQDSAVLDHDRLPDLEA